MKIEISLLEKHPILFRIYKQFCFVLLFWEKWWKMHPNYKDNLINLPNLSDFSLATDMRNFRKSRNSWFFFCQNWFKFSSFSGCFGPFLQDFLFFLLKVILMPVEDNTTIFFPLILPKASWHKGVHIYQCSNFHCIDVYCVLSCNLQLSCLSILWPWGHHLSYGGSYGFIYVINVKFHVLIHTDHWWLLLYH